ncbi:MAG: hypothetical protein ACOC5C_06135 [Halobacteriota archaeon]
MFKVNMLSRYGMFTGNSSARSKNVWGVDTIPKMPELNPERRIICTGGDCY